MITAEIKMGDDYSTILKSETIEGIIEMIKDRHTMDDFVIKHLSEIGELDSEVASGWWFKEVL